MSKALYTILLLLFLTACKDKPHPALKPNDTFYLTLDGDKEHYIVKATNKHGVIISRAEYNHDLGFFTWEDLNDKSFILDKPHKNNKDSTLIK